MGLRTLVMAKKKLTTSFYHQWAEKYRAAYSDIQNREKLMDAISDEIEKDLDLVGATAVEDKLQEDVPQTIFSLREAGILVWVLTGDKIETAINIAFSCKLLTDQMVKLIIDEKTVEQFTKKMENSLQIVKKCLQIRNQLIYI